MVKLVLDSLEGLPDALASEYEERDGSYLLKAESAGGLEVVETKTSNDNMNRIRNERDAFKNKLRAFEKLGKGPDEIAPLMDLADLLPEGKDADYLRTAIAALEKTGGDPDKAVEDRVRQQVASALKKHEDELSKRDTDVQRMRSSLHNTLVTSEVTRALADAGVKGVPAQLLAAHIERAVRVSEDQDGDAMRYGIEVLQDGEKRYGADGSPFTVKALVEELKGNEEYAALFPGSGSSGAGSKSPGNNNNNNGQTLPGGVRVVGGKKVISRETFQKWARGEGATPDQLVANMSAIGKGEITVEDA